MTAFELLDRRVQEVLYRMGWTELRPIQAEAIERVLRGDEHLLVCAQTAAGKTEAAFLPIVSAILADPRPGVRALYVGPLRALINDQFRRIGDLCEAAEIPVWRWHGDVPASRKKRLLEDPSGILLITPESLESLFVNRSAQLEGLFAGLDFVVLDEFHVFLGSERGRHLASLLARLRRMRPDFRKLALSATVGSPDDARRVLDRDDPARVRLVEDPGESKEIRLRVHAFETGTDGAHPASGQEGAEDAIAHEILRTTRGRSALIFANSRGDVEVYADRVRQLCREHDLPDRVLVHHGSLSKELREEAETQMKEEAGRLIFCTSTLEMGIDVGNVGMTVHLGAPGSVAGFVQRLGRSGRRDGEPRIGRFFLDVRRARGSDVVRDCVPELLQTVAVVEAMRERWLEAPRLDPLDFSTLAQQVMSLIRQTGGVDAARAYRELCAEGAFPQCTRQQFAALLRSLGARDVLEQAPDGMLILGLAGEGLANRYDFYAAFQSSEEYEVLHGSRKIGKLPLQGVPEVDEHLVLAGRRWVVRQVEVERKRLAVEPARGRKRPLFLGGGGEVDHAVRRRMRAVLLGDAVFPYLDETAARLLAEARAHAHDQGLDRADLVPLSGGATAWFTWTGTREQQTLAAMLRACEVNFDDRKLMFRLPLELDEAAALVDRLAMQDFDPLALARGIEPKHRRKYDEWLDDALLVEALAHDVVDVEAARRVAADARLPR